jgi:hypothetical protein
MILITVMSNTIITIAKNSFYQLAHDFIKRDVH